MKLRPTRSAYDLFHQGATALARIEANGIRVDVDYLQRADRKAAKRIARMEEELRADPVWQTWRREFGHKANMGARPQLARVLFDVMKITSPGETAKSKRHKTDALSLEAVALTVPFVKILLRMEQWKKLRATYLGGLIRETVDGFLHPVFNLHTVSTYRSSSSDPNFQNLPIRDGEFAEVIRKGFIPRPGRRLVENDFGALEFRIAACFWQDPEMVKYASDPTLDIHRDMAAECYACEPWQVSKDSRYCGKNQFVFPVLYGSYYVQCAKHLWENAGKMGLRLLTKGDANKKGSGATVYEHLAGKGIAELGACDPKQSPKPGTFEHHIKGVETRFMERFSTFAHKKDEWYTAYRKVGGFISPTGFVEDGLFSKNDLQNHPIQGSGFHCLLWTLIKQQTLLDKRGMQSLLVGQIHDCLLGDVPEDELQEYLRLVKKVVSRLLPQAWEWIIVPLEIEAEVTPVDGSWWEKSQWEEQAGTWKEKT